MMRFSAETQSWVDRLWRMKQKKPNALLYTYKVVFRLVVRYAPIVVRSTR
jgi:hypothetical protein